MANLILNERYRSTLDFLYSHLPMFHRVGAAAFKKDLTNTIALCDHLGNPHQKFLSVHVAGTNGKGSVSHFLSAFCQAAGLKTGLYTSPHYKDFRERIKINNQLIPKKRVIEFVAKTKDAVANIQPSFFELCVAMAFDHFAREKVDIAIIEVGLGGRLDSTNVITPLLSVITNISFDHTDLLGNTLPLIATEKAGIIKPGIPVVIGETHPETAPVFMEKAVEANAPICFADAAFEITQVDNSLLENARYHVFKNQKPYIRDLEAAVRGPYQTKNLATFTKSAEILFDLPDFKALRRPKTLHNEIITCIRYGMEHLVELTRFQGRWQVIGRQPTILCDSAHNEAGLAIAMKAVSDLNYARLHIVTGFVNDKDLGKALRQFPASAKYYFAKANIPRGLDARILAAAAGELGLKGKAYTSVKNALKAACRGAEPNDLIVVIGSIFVVAEVV